MSFIRVTTVDSQSVIVNALQVMALELVETTLWGNPYWQLCMGANTRYSLTYDSGSKLAEVLLANKTR